MHLLGEGDPTQGIMVMAEPIQNFKIIIKNGKIYKSTCNSEKGNQHPWT